MFKFLLPKNAANAAALLKTTPVHSNPVSPPGIRSSRSSRCHRNKNGLVKRHRESVVGSAVPDSSPFASLPLSFSFCRFGLGRAMLRAKRAPRYPGVFARDVFSREEVVGGMVKRRGPGGMTNDRTMGLLLFGIFFGLIQMPTLHQDHVQNSKMCHSSKLNWMLFGH